MIGYDPLTSVKQVHESSKVFANTQLPRYNLVYLRSMSQFGISVPGKEPTEQLLGYDVNHTMDIIANSITS